MAMDFAEIDNVIYNTALNYARQYAWWSIATWDKLACDLSYEYRHCPPYFFFLQPLYKSQTS